MRLFVTGGAGFIGSNFVRYWLNNHSDDEVIVFDALTYAGHLSSLQDLLGLEEIPSRDEITSAKNGKLTFMKGDITDSPSVIASMESVDIVVHFAAESHVDRSIIDPFVFIKTNMLGTGVLLDAAVKNQVKRFHHVSTDEVFGQLKADDNPFVEDTKYAPRTPYSASKAGSDHLVRAYYQTYELPITITNCSNNYGPYHDPEKLIPRFITNLLDGKKVPLMGKGENVRDWLYVEDHVRAIETVLLKGQIGETYCVGGEEKTNVEVTKQILKILKLGEEMIEYVPERLGHDFRYAIDPTKLEKLGWKPLKRFDERLKETVEWYKDHEEWWRPLTEGRPVVDRVAQKTYAHH